MGNDNFTAAPSGAFKTGSGLLNIAANKQEQFEALAKVIGREDLITDSRFADREDRKRHRAALTQEVEAALRSKPAAEWETILIGVGIPAGRVVTVPEALENPQVKHRDLLQDFDDVPGVDRPIKRDARRLQALGRQSLGEIAATAPRRAHRRSAAGAGLQRSGNRGSAPSPGDLKHGEAGMTFRTIEQ